METQHGGDEGGGCGFGEGDSSGSEPVGCVKFLTQTWGKHWSEKG